MKIYDCFNFHDELDVLEIHLGELYDSVDKFVIVEATKTFRMKEKALFFADNRSRYIDFLDKINYVVVNTYPSEYEAKFCTDSPFLKSEPCHVERSQRNCLLRGLTEASAEDLIIISDVDEIVKPLVLEKIKTEDLQNRFTFNLNWYQYYVNIYRGSGLCNVGVRFKDLKSPHRHRIYRDSYIILNESGWHLSYLGGPEKVKFKMQCSIHVEFDTPELTNINKIKAELQSLPTSSMKNHPDYFLKNIGKFKHLIK